MIRRRSAQWILFLALLAGGAAIVSAAHSKARLIEPLNATFHTAAPGTIEASLDPPIAGVLRIVVRARAPEGQPQSGGRTGAYQPESASQLLILEVTQSDRPIPFRVVSQSNQHHLVSQPPVLIADIDVNDLTPGVQVHLRVHSNLTDPPDLEARAYQVVY